MEYIFFFKQKTAYEMRSSDWSSDVCSSDLSVTASVRFRIKSSARTASSARACSASEAASADEPLCASRPAKTLLASPWALAAVATSSLSWVSCRERLDSDSQTVSIDVFQGQIGRAHV